MTCFVIAEAGVNHNGSADLALKLVEAAADAGADAVKFQTFSADKLVRDGTKTADYQQDQTGEVDQFTLLRKLELPASVYPDLVSRCHELGIEFMSTPFDPESVDFLLKLGMHRIKVPSGEITNLPFLEYLAMKQLPLIVSTGMADLDEVGEGVAVIRQTWSRHGLADPQPRMLTLLHCTSNYPADFKDVNLLAMQTLARKFGVPVGYSDHTQGMVVAIAAVSLGATVIEKHLTLARNMPGPDHQASLEPSEFRDMVDSIHTVETSLGTGEKMPTASELPIRELVRRSVTVKRPLIAGQIIAADDVVLLRPGTGIAPRDLSRVIGMRARTNLPPGKTLAWSDVSK